MSSVSNGRNGEGGGGNHKWRTGSPRMCGFPFLYRVIGKGVTDRVTLGKNLKDMKFTWVIGRRDFRGEKAVGVKALR